MDNAGHKVEIAKKRAHWSTCASVNPAILKRTNRKGAWRVRGRVSGRYKKEDHATAQTLAKSRTSNSFLGPLSSSRDQNEGNRAPPSRPMWKPDWCQGERMDAVLGFGFLSAFSGERSRIPPAEPALCARWRL